MHRSVKLIFLLLCLPLLAIAQPDFLNIDATSRVAERGLVLQAGGGIAAVNSDICKTPDCNRFGLNYSLGALYKLNSYLAVSTELDFLSLGADDDHPSRREKLFFGSNVYEFSTSLVINLKDSYSGTGDYRSSEKRFAVPFAKVGVGVIYNVLTKYPEEHLPNPNVYALILPVGGGIRFRFSDQISIAPELIYHISSSDYLDNIGSKNRKGIANPDTDHYGVASVKVLYTPSYTNRIFSKFR